MGKKETIPHLTASYRGMRALLEGSCACGQVVVTDINNIHLAANGPVNRFIDLIDDISAVLCNVILQVNDDHCFLLIFFSTLFQHLQSPQVLFLII